MNIFCENEEKKNEYAKQKNLKKVRDRKKFYKIFFIIHWKIEVFSCKKWGKKNIFFEIINYFQKFECA